MGLVCRVLISAAAVRCGVPEVFVVTMAVRCVCAKFKMAKAAKSTSCVSQAQLLTSFLRYNVDNLERF